MKKRILILLFTLIFSMTSFVTMSASSERELPLLVDNAGLLTDSEEKSLNSKLEIISEDQQCEVAIITVYSLDGKTATEYADDFFDYNGYGYGNDDDGILLLVSMEYSDWAISTYGYAIYAFTDAGQEYMADEFLPYLSDGEYEEAFSTFAKLCDEYLTQARSGSPVGNEKGYGSKGSTSYGQSEEPFSFKRIMISLAIGVIIAAIITGIMKGKLKSVRFQPEASSYVRQESLNIRVSKDLFLYSRVTRHAKPKNTSGSSTHISSSGRSHGGSSGKF